MRHVYPPLNSKIEVYEIGIKERVYEAVTDERLGPLYGKEAKQLSGPKLDITVSEMRQMIWGGGNPQPSTYSRKHNIFYQPDGAKYPIPMHEVRTPAEVEIFKKYGKPGELICFSPWSGVTRDDQDS